MRRVQRVNEMIIRSDNKNGRIGIRGSAITPLLVVLGIVVVLGTVAFFLFVNRQQASELEQLRALQSGLNQTKRQQLEELQGLRAEVGKLAELDETKAALRSAEKSLAAAEKQNAELLVQIKALRLLHEQNLLAGSSPESATAPPPPKRKLTSAAACIENLRAIDRAKKYWAMQHNKGPDDTPRDVDLFGAVKYIGKEPVCPEGGDYSFGKVSEKCRCSIAGHSY